MSEQMNRLSWKDDESFMNDKSPAKDKFPEHIQFQTEPICKGEHNQFFLNVFRNNMFISDMNLKFFLFFFVYDR